MIRFTAEEKTELLELLYVRLDTITDDPDSADQFETERSLEILENKIMNDKEFTDQEIDWMIGEATSYDHIDAIAKIGKLLAKHTEKPIITAVQKHNSVDRDTFALSAKLPLRKVIWSDAKYTQIYQYNDGGRKQAGYKGTTGDCVCRAISIASGLPYQQVYDALAEGNARQRTGKYNGRAHGKKTANAGIMTNRKWFKDYMISIGFDWIPTMFIGSGTKIHLRSDELPKGRLVIAVSKHYTAMIDGELHDTWDCSRQGSRCVYGYYIKK